MAGTSPTLPPAPVSSKNLDSFEALVVNAGVGPEQFFRQLKKDLASTPDPLRAVNNLHRFLSTGFTSSILHDFAQHPVLQQVALELFAQSQYLADILVRDPELFRWMTAGATLKVSKSRSELLEEVLSSIRLFGRIEKKLDAVRRFHRREMLRIGARDVLGEADVTTIVSELSALADAVVEAVLQIGHEDLAARTQAQFENTMCVIGLGKLGGEELNFSSDIDLLFLYDADGEFDAPQERIRTFHEYYNRLAEFVVRKLTEFGAEGHLYRVDMRLRPEGSSGPLALSRNAYLQYYEIRGELWERQMLLKARPVAGNVDVGRRWLEDLRPFISPKTVLSDPIAEIAAMKDRIEERPAISSNIKLGEGGIRDIEFIVQALQLVPVSGEKPSRETNTLQVLDELEREGRLNASQVSILKSAYRFLRTVEHRLQLLHGTQTHSMPGTPEETTLLARRLGFKSGKIFSDTIRKHRTKVRVIFNRVFRRSHLEPRPAVVELHPQFGRFGFHNSAEAETIFESLSADLVFLRQAEHRRAFLLLLKKFNAPDEGLRNIALVAASPAIRRTLNQAFSRTKLLELLTLICSRSRRFSELLAREPLLFETLAGQPEEFFVEQGGWTFLRDHDWTRYKSYNEFKILLNFLLVEQTIEYTLERLSDLAEDILTAQFHSIESSDETCLIALGKCGGREMNIGSDVDLILLYDRNTTAPLKADAVAKHLIRQFASGPYELDFRLRPEGSNAPVATEVGYYEDYLAGRASLWERQSLLKARVLAGDERLAARVEDLVRQHSYGTELPRGWVRDTETMRKKMEVERTKGEVDLKMGKGGLADLEFAVQMLQLRYGRDFKQLQRQNSFQVIHELEGCAVIPKLQVKALLQGFAFLRSLETYVRLNSATTDFIISGDIRDNRTLAAAMRLKSVAQFQKTIRALRTRHRTLFRTILTRCRK